MKAQYDDKCRGCGDPIAEGDEIHWSREAGPRCLDCGPEGVRGGATALEDAPGYVRVLVKRLEAAEARCDELEQKNNAQAADAIQLRAWAERLSTELGVDPPELAE